MVADVPMISGQRVQLLAYPDSIEMNRNHGRETRQGLVVGGRRDASILGEAAKIDAG